MNNNDYIKEQTGNRIKFYEYPPTGDVDKPYIIIEPLATPKPSDFADNTWLKYDFLIQIEVWTLSRQTTRLLTNEIRELMWNKLGFHQTDGIDEWDKETGIFRQALRFRSTLYRNDLII